MTEPETETGRRLLTSTSNEPLRASLRAAIFAIEAEARADALSVEVIARALPQWMVEHPIGTTEAELRTAIAENIRDAILDPEPGP